jgi:hypothetical protein
MDITPLPTAENAKAAIARQEAIEKKCAQAIEHFDLDSSPERGKTLCAICVLSACHLGVCYLPHTP